MIIGSTNPSTFVFYFSVDPEGKGKKAAARRRSREISDKKDAAMTSCILNGFNHRLFAHGRKFGIGHFTRKSSATVDDT